MKYEEWKRVEKIYIKKGTTKTSKTMELITEKRELGRLVEKLEKELHPFSTHLFNAKWQQDQLTAAKDKIKSASAVVIMDYAENYVCSSQDEIQSAHWVNPAVTIHPMMAFINSSSTQGTTTINESLIFITPDLKHDADGVEQFRSIAYPYLQQKYKITHVEEYSEKIFVEYHHWLHERKRALCQPSTSYWSEVCSLIYYQP